MMDLGNRVRDRRGQMGLSLRDLAEHTGLTASFLSQVERGVTSPSIDSLRRIATALEVPVFHFLIEPEEESHVVRSNKRVRLTWPGSQISFQLLTPKLNRKMEAFLTEREPGDETPLTHFSQETEEFIYVLQGQLEVRLGETAYVLGPGDTAYFDGALLQGLRPCGDQTARFISVLTPPVF
jgi:transcriptional regulator with XRE-family HTH domain